MSSMSGDRGTELRQIFYESAQEILQSLNEEALKLEKHPDDLEALRSLRRAVHTLKGDAAACGYKELTSLAHQFEDVLTGEDLTRSATIVETALTAADVFSEMIEAHHNETRVPTGEPLRKLIAQLGSAGPAKTAGKKTAGKATSHKRSCRAKKSIATTVSQKSVAAKCSPRTKSAVVKTKVVKTKVARAEIETIPGWTEYECLSIETARQKSVPVQHVTLGLDPNCVMPEAALQIVRNILGKMGEILAFSPAEARHLSVAGDIEAAVATRETPDTLTQKCRVPGIIAKIKVATLASLRSATTAAAEAPAVEYEAEKARTQQRAEENSRPATAENLLRVDSERIDTVLNLVGELIIGRSMFQQTLLEFGKRFPKDPLRARFSDAFAFQSRVLSDLQRSVMKIRMVPVENLFRRFPRLVRDTARICNRNVELVLAGQETDLDKGILDALAEPVSHLVRNAISHGFESAEERQRAGKPETGTLRLAAYHQGNQVVIELSDDGRGIDSTAIRNKAVAQGLIHSDEAQRMTETELFKLIFLPGFSTAEQITEISGRGVGLDVVQNVLQRLKGSVNVESTPGRGTTFRLRLPLTLAIIKAILFRVEHRLYAVPLNAVAEMTRIHQSDVHLVDGHEVLQLRKEVLTLVRLGRPAETTGDSKLFVLVVSHAGQKLGLVVDELAGQEELVIKALDTNLLSSDLISGVSILGDGRVVLILNLAAVAERRSRVRNELGTAPWGLLLPLAEARQFQELSTQDRPPQDLQNSIGAAAEGEL